ncbi:MAG: glutamine--fructose-6-phosphate transaminase (isomerizing) [Actinobacteria bacterium]|nr:glutamine--fructose-6-phosphate transaminase (isomerizing) [Actinomycetota bacterium]
MCGIVGYTGGKQAKSILFEGLRRLEYRGYDSAGICVVSPDGELDCVRAVGNLDNLEKVLEGFDMPGTLGIGHTRWATHGAPTESNAHPHLDCSGDIAIVHNGIIENFTRLRHELSERGHTFKSDTDSETLAHLIEEHYRGDLAEALRKGLSQVEGSFAVVAACRKNPGEIVGARRNSPLVVGIAPGEYYVASAVPAFLSRTRTVLFLDDDEILSIGSEGLKIILMDGSEVQRDSAEVGWDIDSAEKGGYEDFMLKEIFEQKKAVEDTLADKFNSRGEIEMEGLDLSGEEARNLRRIIVVACGTSYHAGILAKFLLEKWGCLPVEIEIASEFHFRDLAVAKGDLVIAISQSGETADTIASVKAARKLGARVTSIVNVVGSQMGRDSDDVIYTHAGPEIGVAATKTFTSQMAVMYPLAMSIGLLRGTVSSEICDSVMKELRSIPSKMENVLDFDGTVREVAGKFQNCPDFLYLGRSFGYPIAMEGALKLKEISYIHAEGYPAGEMKHGPIALLDDGVPVVAIATRDSVYDKMINNIEEVKARKAPVVAVTTVGDTRIADICEAVFEVPETMEVLYPLLTVIPLQLLAYHIAKFKGCNVDQPRNLAKTVTVE